MRNVNKTILQAADTTSQNGSQIDANQLIAASFHAYFGDVTAAGTVKIQASNDICNYRNLDNEFTVTNWVDVPNASASVASGAAVLIPVPQMCYRWIRAVYTSTSGGSSTVTVNMNALGL